jgi:hypothetical protein
MVTDSSKHSPRARLAPVVAVWVLGAAALAYLAVAHRPHLLGWLPYLIILACPLMHLFMHRGHHARHAPLEGSEGNRNEGGDHARKCH